MGEDNKAAPVDMRRLRALEGLAAAAKHWCIAESHYKGHERDLSWRDWWDHNEDVPRRSAARSALFRALEEVYGPSWLERELSRLDPWDELDARSEQEPWDELDAYYEHLLRERESQEDADGYEAEAPDGPDEWDQDQDEDRKAVLDRLQALLDDGDDWGQEQEPPEPPA